MVKHEMLFHLGQVLEVFENAVFEDSVKLRLDGCKDSSGGEGVYALCLEGFLPVELGEVEFVEGVNNREDASDHL